MTKPSPRQQSLPKSLSGLHAQLQRSIARCVNAIDIASLSDDIGQVEKQSKNLSLLLKAADELEKKITAQRAEQKKKCVTAYAEIPPPSEDELQTLRRTLSRLYDRYAEPPKES